MKPGARRISSHHATEAEAEARARDIVTKAGGGDVIIHRTNGSVRQMERISPNYLPFRPRDMDGLIS